MSARNRYKRERRKRLAEEAVQRPKREAEILAWQEQLIAAAARHNMATDGVSLELVETARRRAGDREFERINAMLNDGAQFEDAIRKIVDDHIAYGDPREPFDPDK